jgi:hypothetical protein
MMHRMSNRLGWAVKRLHDAAIAGRRVVLGLGGLGLIDAAVWSNSTTWGMVSTGVTLLLLQFLTEDDSRGAR